MPKVTTSISIDSTLKELAIKQGLVLSHFVEEQLRAVLNVDKEKIERLKSLERIQEEKAKASAELYILKEKERQLQEEEAKKEEEANKWKEV